MKKNFGETYLGLDMGTNSVGWAVTDTEYKILKFNGKGMWGARLFATAQTAADTRKNRSNRRRLERRTWRVKLLQSLFSEVIASLDMGFFIRQAESNLQVDDKSSNNRYKNSLFGEGFLSDREYHLKYPTIYHLRLAQINDEGDAFDPRLLYLSLAHIIKYRGHFLIDNLKVDLSASSTQSDKRFEEAYNELILSLQNEFDDFNDYNFGNPLKVKGIMSDRDKNISSKKKLLERELNVGKNKQLKAIAGLLSGGKIKLAELFGDEALKEVGSFGFGDTDFDAVEDELKAQLNEKMEVLYKFKAVFDIAILEELLGNKNSISAAKVDTYNEHQKDLKLLKEFARNADRELYNKIFGVPKKSEMNYSTYIGRCLTHNSKKAVLADYVCSQEDFCKYLSNVLKDYVDVSQVAGNGKERSEIDELFIRINNKIAFPKLRTKANGVIPVQLNEAELKVILKNAEKRHSFLSVKDENGLSVSDKILSILKFRVPYYVGPLAGTELSRKAQRCWVKRSSKKITPWNFDRVVNLSASAENFIRKMTNKCTYLYTEDVLPKNSLLYCEFETRNELNNLSINGIRLDAAIIQDIIDDLIINGKGKVTKKKIKAYLQKKNIISSSSDDNIAGIDDEIKSTMKSHKDFYRIFGKEYVNTHHKQIEDIIKWITLFADEKSMLVNKIRENYPEVSSDKVNEIKKLNYKDWGRLSKTLLNSEDISFYDDGIGEYITIIGAMRRESINLMQLLARGHQYGFAEKIEAFNATGKRPDIIDYDYVNEMAVSPAVKRSIWQTIQVVKELKKIIGHDPKRIFIEMAREDGEKKRTVSRKNQLLEFYKRCKADIESYEGKDFFYDSNYYNDIHGKLNGQEESSLQGKKLFLYYCQLGRDLYTGEKISIDDLFKQNMYDCDHIYPRSKTKDDSLDNMALVYFKKNRDKDADYPLSSDIQEKMCKFWKFLLDKGLMSQKKYDRLMRKVPLTDDELAGFINRQLVETRQSTKAVANLLSIECPNSKIVYSKAGNVSDFRQEFDFVKCRDINDLHHAKDAYLNIVVGNVFYTKFTDKPYEMLKDRKFTYTLNPQRLYQHEIKRRDTVAWVTGEAGTISVVRKMMNKNNIQVTNQLRENHGAIFDATIYKASDNAKLFPIKKGLSPQKYGGYKSQSTAYFVYVEAENKKGQQERSLEAVYCHVANSIKDNQEALLQFVKEEYGLKNPRIIIPKVKIGACLEVDGLLMIITGTTGEQITGKNARQLILDVKYEKYIKKVLQYLSRKKKNQNVAIENYKDISKEENSAVFSTLVEKIKTTPYINRPAINYDDMHRKEKEFNELSIENQCIVLSELLQLLAKSLQANFSLIGGKKSMGSFKISKKMSGHKKVLLHNYSITGLFEQKPVDMLKI
ncbi:type II CRISPR RNA-guided endonuclease Cas9 [Anaerovibrio sp.]|uniref:type II CRISPR RNA-guided endonuclease Cas9 n=1 Tax=Anaerovibrio sp. TaxID=1872532 RepID=UPI00388DC8BA